MSDKTEQCPNSGAYRYTWPGKDESVICEAHAPQLANIAGHMGLYLQLIPLPASWQPTRCDQKIEQPKENNQTFWQLLAICIGTIGGTIGGAFLGVWAARHYLLRDLRKKSERNNQK